MNVPPYAGDGGLSEGVGIEGKVEGRRVKKRRERGGRTA